MYASYTHTTQFARYGAHPVSYSVPCTISAELRQYCRFTLKPHPNQSHAWFEGWMRLVIYGAILVASRSIYVRSRLYCILLNLVYLICSAKRTQSGYGLLGPCIPCSVHQQAIRETIIYVSKCLRFTPYLTASSIHLGYSFVYLELSIIPSTSCPAFQHLLS